MPKLVEHPDGPISAYPHGSVLTRAFGHTLTNPRICDYPREPRAAEERGSSGMYYAGVGGVDTSISDRVQVTADFRRERFSFGYGLLSKGCLYGLIGSSFSQQRVRSGRERASRCRAARRRDLRIRWARASRCTPVSPLALISRARRAMRPCPREERPLLPLSAQEGQRAPPASAHPIRWRPAGPRRRR